ncbi:MAG: hypothetical protein QW767_03580 [Thermoprotei archaeon]
MSATIESVLKQKGRKLLVAYSSIDFRDCVGNRVYVIEVLEQQGAAGGRAAGMGLRVPVKITKFECSGNRLLPTFVTEDASRIELFELPYHSVAQDVVLPDGTTLVVSGVVDPDLVESYDRLVESFKQS